MTVQTLTISVIGTPAPQGSKRHVGRGIMVESSAALAPWRDSVTYAARQAATTAGWTATDGPVLVDVLFRLARPVSAPKRRTLPDRHPDLDKLARGVLDALTTAAVIVDDARVTDLTCRKRYAVPGVETTGATITITQDAAS